MEESYSTFRWYDYLIFAFTLAVSLAIGVYYACTGGKQRTTQEYLLAGRSMGTFPVALSLYVSGTSAILILGSPAEFYEHGITQYLICVGYVCGYILAAQIFVPHFYGMGYTSSYTYLEKRYNSRIIRLAGSFFYLLQSVVYMGLAMYSPAIALEGVTGIPLYVSILVTGAVVVCYSTIGGMKAVIGTDTFQGIVMIAGCLLVLILGTIKIGSVTEIWERASAGGRVDLDFNYSPFARVSIWGAVFGSMTQSWLAIGTNQNTVQRLISTTGAKYAKRVVLWNALLSVLMFTIVYGCGFVVFAYYDRIGCDPLKTERLKSSNQLLPYFIMDALQIPAIPGLFVAVLFCGALSSVSSSLNGMSAVTWKDFLEWKFKDWPEIRKATMNKILVLFYGMIGVGFAFAFNYAPGNTMQMSGTVFGAINGPIDGVFLMGLFFPCAEWIGALIGLVISFVFSATISLGKTLTNPYVSTLPTNDTLCYDYGLNITKPRDGEDKHVFPLFMISFNWYSAIAVYLCVIIALPLSKFVFKNTKKDNDPRLMIPFFDRLLCCLPTKWRKILHCGINYDDREVDELGRYDMKGLENIQSTKADAINGLKEQHSIQNVPTFFNGGKSEIPFDTVIFDNGDAIMPKFTKI